MSSCTRVEVFSVKVSCDRYGVGHPVKHIKLQRALDGSYFLADCKMFRNIIVSIMVATCKLLRICEN
jgi:hypothetical protein